MTGIPRFGNTVLFGLFAAFMNARFDAMDKRLDAPPLKHFESR
jgi:hypothetical protein